MNSADWPQVRLDSLAVEVTVGHVGPMVHEYRLAGIPFLRSQNVRRFTITSNDLRFISPEFHQRLRKSRLGPGDVVVVRTGTPGVAAVVPQSLVEANCADLVIIRPSDALNPHYLAYLLNGVTQHQIDAQIVGAVQQHFNVTSAKQLRIPLPPRPEQDAIVTVLRALDDKIELNRRMNQTLEAMARALFQSWFLDFDPVVARAARSQPFGLAVGEAALFPERFRESELGPVPLGWQVSRVGLEFAVTMGQSPPGSTYNVDGAGVPFYQGRADFAFRFPSRRVYCTAPTRFSDKDDTLVTVRAPVGSVNMASEKCAIGRGVAAVRHKGGSASYTFYAMHSLGEAFGVFEGQGTLFGSIGRDDFDAMPILAPPPPLVDLFQARAGALDTKIEANERQSLTLVTVRDTLLPKLLSGEIRLQEAEEVVVGR